MASSCSSPSRSASDSFVNALFILHPLNHEGGIPRSFPGGVGSDGPATFNRMTTQTTLFTPTLPPKAEMERAFLASDAGYDGIFVTAVRTTGIFCRPSCRARKPLPANIEFFATIREALFAGYRPCKRCDPATPPGTSPGWVKPLLELVDADPNRRLHDEDLRARDIDPARARR